MRCCSWLCAGVVTLLGAPLAAIAHAPQDRVATAVLEALFGEVGAYAMAAAIVVSTLGCNNGPILSGARVYYAMARDRVFFAAKKCKWNV